MKKIIAFPFLQLILLLFVITLFACEDGQRKAGPAKTVSSGRKRPEPASFKAHFFYDWWIKQTPGKVHLNDLLRNKLMNKTDVKELKKYFARNGLKAGIFGNLEDSVKLMEYKSFNFGWIKNDVLWIDQNRLRGCRSISKDAMWECLEQDYGIKDYYYVSSPIFSVDGKWAIASINYMEKSGAKSKGATRLFKNMGKGQWSEVAILTYWGNFEQ